MDRCQRKPGCENLADRDGCEETQGVREKQKAKSHICGWREKLQGGQEIVRRQGLGHSKFRGKGKVSPPISCVEGVRGTWVMG